MKSVELINNLIQYVIDNDKLPVYSDIDNITRNMSFDIMDPELNENELWNSIITLCNTLITKKIPIFTNYKFHRMFSYISLHNKFTERIQDPLISIINNELYAVARYIEDVSKLINDEFDKYVIAISDYEETYLYNHFPTAFKRITWEEITNEYVALVYSDIYVSTVNIFDLLTALHTLASTLFNIFSQDIFRQIAVDIINVILYDKSPVLSI
jgi:hypothetical protein